MQLWFAHGSEISLRQQLVTQVVLGVLSGDLVPGQRLPSTRELARRFRLHPNTVSAGYRQLEREHWVERRHGSGVYISNRQPKEPLPLSLALDDLIVKLFRSARGLGAALPVVRARLRQWLEMQPPDHFLLIEPEEELRGIVAGEMRHAVTFPVASCGLEDCQRGEVLAGAIPVVLPNKVKAAEQVLPAETELLTLQFRSVPASLAAWLPAPSGALVGIASRWPDFLKLARTILTAAGFHADGLLFRDARKPNWQRGLEQTAAVVCDSITAKSLPRGCRAIPFPLLAESSLVELQRYQAFICDPLPSSK